MKLQHIKIRSVASTEATKARDSANFMGLLSFTFKYEVKKPLFYYIIYNSYHKNNDMTKLTFLNKNTYMGILVGISHFVQVQKRLVNILFQL